MKSNPIRKNLTHAMGKYKIMSCHARDMVFSCEQGKQRPWPPKAGRCFCEDPVASTAESYFCSPKTISDAN